MNLIGTRFALESKGTFEAVDSMVKEVATINVPLQIALSIGVAGLLVPIANTLGLMSSKSLIVSIA